MSKPLEVEFTIRNAFCKKCLKGTIDFAELKTFVRKHKEHFTSVEFDAILENNVLVNLKWGTNE